MKHDATFEDRIRHLEVTTDPARDGQILDYLLQAQREACEARARTHAGSSSALRRRHRSAALVSLVGAVVAVVLVILLADRATTPLWAVDQAIAAMRGYQAVHIVAAVPDATIELWTRSDPARSHSVDVLVRAPGGVTTWTRHGATYHYDPESHTVYTEPAITVGFVPWLGPALLETLARAPGAKVLRGRESVFGRRVVTLIGSIHDVKGPQSWVIRFDADTNLPVSFRVWANLDRSGAPAFDALRITFHDDLPDSMFDVYVPPDTRTVERPLTIPDETLGLLAGPEDGIVSEGLTQQEAVHRILRRLGEALVAQDVSAFRRLTPVARLWSDDFLKALLLAPANDHDRIVELVEVGQIAKSGQSRIGPIVAVPFITRRADGSLVRDRLIVQFRDFGGQQSCVVFGPYGLPEVVE